MCFFIIALTFLTASVAILPSFPVGINLPSDLEPAGVTSATIGMHYACRGYGGGSHHREAVDLPYAEALCREYLVVLACILSAASRPAPLWSGEVLCGDHVFLGDYLLLLSTAMSPAALISPPRSLSMSVSLFFLPALLLASSIISSTALLSKWGIFPSFCHLLCYELHQ